MGTNRFVKPQIVRLPLSAGDFIDVKKRLNTGEQQDLHACMVATMTAGEKVLLNSKSVMTAKVLAYLLTWSLTDEGQPVPMSPEMDDQARLSTLRNLDPDTFREIREAIESHEAAIEKETTDAKNVQAGESTSPALSTSAAL